MALSIRVGEKVGIVGVAAEEHVEEAESQEPTEQPEREILRMCRLRGDLGADFRRLLKPRTTYMVTMYSV